MCLDVTKRYEYNEEERVAYKVFIEEIQCGKKVYKTVYQEALLDENGEMYVLNPPTFKDGQLFGGAIHCFASMKDAENFVKNY